MSVEKCKILWIDDELSPEYSIWEIYEIAEKNYKDRLCIDVVLNAVDFEAKITKNRYDAVIMDVNITEDYVDGEPAPMIGRICKLCSEQINNYNLQLYAFTGALSLYNKKRINELKIQLESSFKRDPVSGMFYWDKSSGLKIFDEILKNYDERMYAGFEYLLDIFSKGWIKKEHKVQFLDPIMECYSKKDYDSAHGNQMRNLVEQMLYCVNEEFKLVTTMQEDDSNRPAAIINSIKLKRLDMSSSVVGPLKYMIEVSNAESHNAMSENERKLYFHSDFSTFFVVTDWFYRLMTCVEESKNNYADCSSRKPQTQESKNNYTDCSSRKPQTHEKRRTSIAVKTYIKDNDTYCNLKLKIPTKYAKDEVEITSIEAKSHNNGKKFWHIYFQ